MPVENILNMNRRSFFASQASGLGLLATASLLGRNAGLSASPIIDPARLAHIAPKAKSAICIYLEGGPSQMDLFDPKPKLNELNGQKLPESMTEKVRFAFIQKEGARLLGSGRKFQKYGQCGMELSDFLP
ncbi:MAG: DUF1501 domain-containing protein, partial [Planctomycetia bacterium]